MAKLGLDIDRLLFFGQCDSFIGFTVHCNHSFQITLRILLTPDIHPFDPIDGACKQQNQHNDHKIAAFHCMQYYSLSLT
ncbi:hypothetical protein D3C87_2062850 [compost metagenome]